METKTMMKQTPARRKQWKKLEELDHHVTILTENARGWGMKVGAVLLDGGDPAPIHVKWNETLAELKLVRDERTFLRMKMGLR